MNDELFTNLLNEFKSLPKDYYEPTFLEICKYPYSRFEEVCSRILQFYFNPNAEHNFGNLWLRSLLELVGEPLPINNDTIINTEENAEGKRIDITIVSDIFVIGIENKITAGLYNPLDIYKKHIECKYPDKKKILLVLSLKRIDKTYSKNKGFSSYTYNDLFNFIYHNLRNHITNCNQKYLSYMLDFIKTINNLDNSKLKDEDIFFFNNWDNIKDLINRFNQYKERMYTAQREQINILQEEISKRTGANWWAYKGWDLGINFNEGEHRIGIEARYQCTKDDFCGELHPCITTWKIEDWMPYQNIILKEEEFSNKKPRYDYKNNRVFLDLPILKENNHEKILDTLEKYFKIMSTIASQIS